MKYWLEWNKIDNALTNTVYTDGKDVCKVYDLDDRFKHIYGNQEQLVLNLLKRDYKWQDYNVICMKYIKHDKFDTNNLSNEQINQIAGLVKKFHYLPAIARKISFKKLWRFLESHGHKCNEEEIKKVKLAIKYLKKDKVLVHGDIVDGNILLLPNKKITLIDFEYSGLANRLWDIASFVTEREISQEQEKLFIEKYFEIEKDKKINFNKEQYEVIKWFAYLFWYKWALYKYDLTKKEVYKQIADWKYKYISK